MISTLFAIFTCVIHCHGHKFHHNSNVDSSSSIVVNTSYGLIAGETTYNGRVNEFKSIPYAAPPINDLRWQNPTKHIGWHNRTLDATVEPWGCPQNCADPGTPGVCPSITKEDCLILNIYTPNAKTSDNDNQTPPPWPVMVYVHGGSWMENYGGGIRLNATNVVNFTQNVIIVLINYRLGALGMFYDESLDIYGNYMYLDQKFAVEWIYNEISNFGGDKDNIMLYGESAGGNSMLLHLIDKTDIIGPSRVKAVIGESSVPGAPWQTPETWNKSGIANRFARLLGCGKINNNNNTLKLECLQNVSSTKIVDIQDIAIINSSIGWAATVKNELFPDQAIFCIQKGLYNKQISTIFGNNAGEAYLFVSTQSNQSNTDFISYWNSKLGESITNKMIKYYNLTDVINCSTCNLINYTIIIDTDYLFRCPSRNITSELVSQQTVTNHNNNDNVYNFVSHRHYHLNYASKTLNKEWFPDNPDCWTHVCHTNELWYLFNDDLNELPIHNISWSEEEILLRNQFVVYWTNYASNIDGNHDPNKGNNKENNKYLTVNWTNFNVNDKNTLAFDIKGNMKMINDPDANPCEFWDSTQYSWIHV